MFKIGDIVTWKSQAQGYEKVKTGEIVGVVPANRIPYPSSFVKKYHPFDFIQMYGCSLPRKEESYIVKVKDGKTDEAKPKLYWPRVKSLTLVK